MRNEITSLFDMTRTALSAGDRRNRVAVLGLGNVLLSDEGVGVHAVNALHRRFAFSPSIDIIDGGTMGLDLLPLFQERDWILIIDAVDFGKPAGHIEVLQGEAIPAALSGKLSVHHIGLSDLIFAARLVREVPPDVRLVGIQPHSLEMSLDLSDVLVREFENLIRISITQLNAWRVQCDWISAGDRPCHSYCP